MENEVVELLRDRAEEDLDDVIKSSMGGYNKKSVRDYVAQLRRQQQATSQRFNEDMKSVLAEKEALKTDLKRMKARLSKREAQYRALAESLQEYRQSEESEDAENALKLKQQVANQENMIAALEADKQLQIQRQEQSEQYIEELKKDLEKNEQEHRLTKEILHDEKKKGMSFLKQLRELSSQLATAQEEIEFLRQKTSEGEVAKLREKVDELQNELKLQQELLEQRREELEIKEKELQSSVLQIDMKDKQSKMLEEKAEKLKQTIEMLTLQNQDMEAYQQELVLKLKEVFSENLNILHKKSELYMENLKLSKKIDDISREISLDKSEQADAED